MRAEKEGILTFQGCQVCLHNIKANNSPVCVIFLS
jgi:hypothetical protein